MSTSYISDTEFGVLSDEDKIYLMNNGYEIMENIGSSYDHLVFKARTRSGQVVAIKYLEITNKRKLHYLQREIEITDFLRDHPNRHLVQVLANIKNEIEKKVFTVMEFGGGGDLVSYFQRRKWTPIDEPLAKYWFDQLLSGVKWLHDNGIAHRDIKCDNVVMFREGDGFRLKLTDLEMAIFGVTRVGRFKQVAKCNTVCGSVEYAAPEIFVQSYDPFLADIYSLGVILHVFIAGKSPFKIYGSELLHVTDRINRSQHLKNNSEFKFSPKSSQLARNLVTRMLDPKPETRMSLQQVLSENWVSTELEAHRDFWQSIEQNH